MTNDPQVCSAETLNFVPRPLFTLILLLIAMGGMQGLYFQPSLLAALFFLTIILFRLIGGRGCFAYLTKLRRPTAIPETDVTAVHGSLIAFRRAINASGAILLIGSALEFYFYNKDNTNYAAQIGAIMRNITVISAWVSFTYLCFIQPALLRVGMHFPENKYESVVNCAFPVILMVTPPMGTFYILHFLGEYL